MCVCGWVYVYVMCAPEAGWWMTQRMVRAARSEVHRRRSTPVTWYAAAASRPAVGVGACHDPVKRRQWWERRDGGLRMAGGGTLGRRRHPLYMHSSVSVITQATAAQGTHHREGGVRRGGRPELPARNGIPGGGRAPLVGSSRNRMVGETTSSQPIATRRRWPPLTPRKYLSAADCNTHVSSCLHCAKTGLLYADMCVAIRRASTSYLPVSHEHLVPAPSLYSHVALAL